MPIPASSAPPTPCPFIPGLSPDPCFVASIQVGSNAATGSPGASLGHDPAATANVIWDANPSDGFDSGWVSVQLVGQAGGGSNGMTWTIIQPDGTQINLSSSDATCGTIDQVQISAAVSTPNMTISYRSIQAAFYKDGKMTDAVSLPDDCAPVADTNGPNPPSGSSEVTQLIPQTPNNDKVVITAMVRIQSSQTGVPPASAIVGQINIYCEDCDG